MTTPNDDYDDDDDKNEDLEMAEEVKRRQGEWWPTYDPEVDEPDGESEVIRGRR